MKEILSTNSNFKSTKIQIVIGDKGETMLKREAVIVIPAHNEAKTIEPVLKTCLEAKHKGLVKEVVVINDGSKDRTGEIAERRGAKVVTFKHNMGKGWAFLSGASQCRLMGAKTMIMFDADLLNLKLGHIEKLLERTSKKDVKMVVMGVSEKKNMTVTKEYSGQRAIKMEALNFLFMKGKRGKRTKSANRFMKMASGYGLETTLNYTIKKEFTTTFVPRDSLIARAAAIRSYGKQAPDLKHASDLIKKRKTELVKAREKRATRQSAKKPAVKRRKK